MGGSGRLPLAGPQLGVRSRRAGRSGTITTRRHWLARLPGHRLPQQAGIDRDVVYARSALPGRAVLRQGRRCVHRQFLPEFRTRSTSIRDKDPPRRLDRRRRCRMDGDVNWSSASKEFITIRHAAAADRLGMLRLRGLSNRHHPSSTWSSLGLDYKFGGPFVARY